MQYTNGTTAYLNQQKRKAKENGTNLGLVHDGFDVSPLPILHIYMLIAMLV